ncbi:MAG: NUDIX domain-containing protein [Chloroflexaceae bacterium]|nr:NUDIX domain-containing protein [Chloroflexaceae bacterium]
MRVKETLLNLVYTWAIAGTLVFRQVTRATRIGVRALVVRENEVVLVRHRGGVRPWGLPGGGMHPHETLEEAVRREVREEAGCMVQVVRLHGIYYANHRGYQNGIVVFVCAPLTDLCPPANDLEIVTACYADMHALPAGTDVGTHLRVGEYVRGEVGVVGQGWNGHQVGGNWERKIK